MTLQECYVKIGGDYNDILHRFMNENMVRKFVLKFPQDNNMALFEESWTKKNYETAFRAMHTLKGVAINLGFTTLYKEFRIMDYYGNEKGLFLRRNFIL